MIVIKEKKHCCGCGACAQICPQKCISMVEDEEGFLYPYVDEKTCVECGACRRACPILEEKQACKELPQAYVAYSKDEKIREESSSGGIFSLLAEWVLQQEGVVFGAAFDNDFAVHHIEIDSLEELYKLRGSKYLQSRIEDTYTQAKAALEAGRIVLFSGVGCQIAGLKSYLRKNYDNLYTVDVLCHGVPSPKLWRKYIQAQEACYGDKICAASFRNKKMGWHGFASVLSFRNAIDYCQHNDKDTFMKCFLRNICLRASCYDCQFRKGKSGADITLGDAWGIENWMPEMDDDKGTSVVLVHNDKGRKLWEMVEALTSAKAGDAKKILEFNSVFFKSVAMHPNRRRFFCAMNHDASMEALVQLTREPLHRRMLSFGKRAIKSILRKMGIL